jgi:hypothetical protein
MSALMAHRGGRIFVFKDVVKPHSVQTSPRSFVEYRSLAELRQDASACATGCSEETLAAP